MMVSNRLTNIPAQVVCTEDVDLEASNLPVCFNERNCF